MFRQHSDKLALLSVRALSLSGLIAVILGLWLTQVLQGLDGLVTFHGLLILTGMLILGVLLSRVANWPVANTVLLLALLLLVHFVGIAPLLAAFLVAAASLVIGSVICRSTAWGDVVVASLCGLALLAAVAGWLLPFRVHYFSTYLIFLGAIVFLGRKRLMGVAGGARRGWLDAVSAAPLPAVLGALAIAMAALALCPPTVQYDDLVLHLFIPEQLLAFGYYKIDVASQVWSAAPWASDVVQGYVAILAGHEARGAANLIWFCLSLAGIWTLGGELGLTPPFRWMAIALYASLPTVSALHGTMQADTAITAVTVALTAIVARISNTRRAALLFPFFIISGLALALKTTQALLVVPLALVALAYVGFGPFFRQLARGFIPALLIFGSSHTYAWLLTGNPLFPLFNGFFKSPYAPLRNFDDPRWHHGFGLDTLWALTFHTNLFQEASAGSIGFSLLALSGCLLAALCIARVRWIALALLAAALGTFAGIQYARYLVPLFPALIVIALVVWQRARLNLFGQALLTFVVWLNILFIPLSVYIYEDDLYWTMLSNINTPPDVVKADIQRKFAIELLVAKHLDLAWPAGYSLYLADPGRPFIAPFAGRAFGSAWYDPSFLGAAGHADEDASGNAWAALFERTGISHVLTTGTVSPALQSSLQRMQAAPELTEGDSILWRICKLNCNSASHPLIDARDFSVNAIRAKR
ncbi:MULTISPECIES: hypothetical protein [unclassified Dyella]|uniref:hypothetical protein n=1 Tax=unclassified Dyella TaxID=2634549 RepID=UPI003F92FFCB